MSDVKAVITEDDLLARLGIDYADDMVNKNIAKAIAYADGELRESVGDEYPVEDPRAKELALMIVADLYDNRGLTVSNNVSTNMRKLVDNMSLQLRLELRRAASNG